MTAVFLHLVFLNENVLFVTAFRSLVLNYTYMILFLIVFKQRNELYVSLEHKTSLKSLRYICSNSQQYIVCQRFPTVNISKLNYWLVICIAKNNFKDDFLNIQIFLHPQIPDFQILSKPYINGNMIYSAFRWCINLNFTKITFMTGFVLQGHVYGF